MEAITTANFPTSVLESTEAVLVDFWGPQCSPCLALMPAVEQLATRYDGQVKVVKVNARENPRLCIQLKVFGLPTFLLFKDGTEVGRLAGDTITPADLDQLIQQAI